MKHSIKVKVASKDAAGNDITELKEFGLSFGYTCFKLFYKGIKDHKNTFLDSNGITDEGAVNLVSAAYTNFCLAEKINEELTFDQIYEAVDELIQTEEGLNQVKDYYIEFLKSKPMEKLQKKSPEMVEAIPV